MLEINDLALHYKTIRGAVRALDGVGLCLDKGQALGVVGESGCGKSTLALAILRVLPRNAINYEGNVSLNGIRLMELSDDEFRKKIRWRKISMVFQGAMNSLNPVIRVGDQVADPLRILEEVSASERRERVLEVFEWIGLRSEIYDRFPHELSGGMKQRVVIAMALLMSPELIILDEPTSALDVSVQAQIMNLLKELKQKLAMSMIFITHDIALASDLSDRFVVMYAGKVAEDGSAEDVLLSPKHPYTQRLVASAPRLRSFDRPAFIPGAPPDLVAPPSGCRFHPRCPFVMDVCKVSEPPMLRTIQSQAACWLYGAKNAGNR